MASKEEDKYIVIKREDISLHLTGFQAMLLEDLLNDLKEDRERNGKNTDNKYIVCNQDEPYAEPVWQIILIGEEAKRADLDENKLKDTFSKFSMEFYRLTKEERTNTRMMVLIHKYFPFILEE